MHYVNLITVDAVIYYFFSRAYAINIRCLQLVIYWLIPSELALPTIFLSQNNLFQQILHKQNQLFIAKIGPAGMLKNNLAHFIYHDGCRN